MEFRLAAFYFLFFAYAGAYVAYFPLYLASRDLTAVEIAGVLALPAIARIIVPTAWGSIADRTGAHRAIVAASCAATAAGFALMPFTEHIAWVIGAMSLLSAGALPLVEAITARLAGRTIRSLRADPAVGLGRLHRRGARRRRLARSPADLYAALGARRLHAGHAGRGARSAARPRACRRTAAQRLRMTPEIIALARRGFLQRRGARRAVRVP